MSGICVVHLVWAPLGDEPLARFLRSYRAHDAGRDHRLLVVLNGFRDDAALASARAVLADEPHEELVPERPLQDLAAYRLAAERATDADALCFLNSHSVLLAGGWLRSLDAGLARAGVGIVGATGSYESMASDAPRPLKPLRRRQFPRFPNPHLRTNAFMLARSLMLDLDWSCGRAKNAAHQLESGYRGITRQVRERRLDALVVGCDGQGHPPEAWPASRTYRSGAQEQLLVADNRTRDYDAAGAAERARLARMAWGDAAVLSEPPAAPAPRA